MLLKFKKILMLDWYKRKYFQFLHKYFPKIYYRKKQKFDVHKYYLARTGKKLNLRNPQNISEKLWWLALYWQNPLVVKCADKYLMHEYVKECGCEEILVPLYGVYDNAEEINFDMLPRKFALKCNHGCGYNILCEDKSKIDIKTIKKRLNDWLLEKYGTEYCEFHYEKIKPKIICEEFLDFSGEKSLIDYKIHCLNGVPTFFFVCTERDVITDKVIFTSYSLKWEKLSLLKNEGEADIPKPECLEEIIHYAELLSKPFPYVRVDLYNVDNKVYLGEMTFTPYANIMSYYKDSTLKMMGEKLKLPQKYKSQSI